MMTAYFNIAASVMNLLSVCFIVLAVLNIRKATKVLTEWGERLRAASGMEARQGRDAAERLDGEAATARPDAQPLEPKD